MQFNIASNFFHDDHDTWSVAGGVHVGRPPAGQGSGCGESESLVLARGPGP